MAILQNSNAISAGGYDVNNSLRFRASNSAYLNRTPASAGNRRAWTWSGWVKRGTLTSTMYLFGASSTTGDVVRFLSTGDIQFYFNNGSNGDIRTTQLFRDPSAWYHLVFVCDTANATAANRMKIYVNGSQITAFQSATYPAQNYDTTFNTAVIHNIAGFSPYFDGYMTEVNFIDGQALTPSSFGSTNSTTGVWQPARYSGTYGTNGFYLNFTDIGLTSGANTGLGKDFSGNANYWTTNNISVTAGTTYDAMTDVPTNTSATVANYCTLNPLRNTAASNGTFSNANLRVTGSNGAINCIAAGTMTVSGQMYWEITVTTIATASSSGVGIVLSSSNQIATAGGMSTGIYYLGNGNKRITGTSSAYGSSYTSGDVIGIAVDTSAETITFYKNNTSQGSISGTGVISLGVLPYIGMDDINSPSVTANFGQRPFSYTPPTGYKALNTFNLPTPTILQGNKYMDATLYTGNGSTQTITNAAGFRPDFVWLKSRSGAYSHCNFDTVRGVQKLLQTNGTGTEVTLTDGLSAFNSNGYTIGANLGVNGSGVTYVGWQWQAGQGTNTTNTDGSITSTVSANPTAGFSVVTYTGTGANATVGHGLGVAPAMVIVKRRSSTGNWNVRHVSITAANSLYLNLTNASQSDPTVWNSTVPTSTVFSIGTDTGVNASGGTYVGYCWAEIAGFSKFGSYTGNGSADGPFVYTGFRPAFVIIKQSSAAGRNWIMFDNKRDTKNEVLNSLEPSNADAEYPNSTGLDFLSNGFKIRSTGPSLNTSAATYIVMAFAESPFASNNRAR